MESQRQSQSADPVPDTTHEPHTRNRAKRWLWPGAAATVGIALAVSGLALSQHSLGSTHPRDSQAPPARNANGQHIRTVAWSSRKAHLRIVTPPTPKAPTPRYPGCSARQLRATPGPIGAGGGHSSQFVVLTNDSSTACTLSGGPSSVSGITKSGRSVRLTTRYARPGPGYDNNMNLLSPANLKPGQSAQVAITTASENMCPASAYKGSGTYARLSVGIGSSGQVSVMLTKFPGSFVATCDVGASAFGTPVPTSPTPPDSPLDALTARMIAPPTLTAGTHVTYTIVLTNPTGHRIMLSPCPSYIESIFRGTNAFGIYYLNCKAAPFIPARGSVSFDIRSRVPDTPGRTPITWVLQDTTLRAGKFVTIAAR
jgi:hypothetical protein